MSWEPQLTCAEACGCRAALLRSQGIRTIAPGCQSAPSSQPCFPDRLFSTSLNAYPPSCNTRPDVYVADSICFQKCEGPGLRTSRSRWCPGWACLEDLSFACGVDRKPKLTALLSKYIGGSARQLFEQFAAVSSRVEQSQCGMPKAAPSGAIKSWRLGETRRDSERLGETRRDSESHPKLFPRAQL